MTQIRPASNPQSKEEALVAPAIREEQTKLKDSKTYTTYQGADSVHTDTTNAMVMSGLVMLERRFIKATDEQSRKQQEKAYIDKFLEIIKTDDKKDETKDEKKDEAQEQIKNVRRNFRELFRGKDEYKNNSTKVMQELAIELKQVENRIAAIQANTNGTFNYAENLKTATYYDSKIENNVIRTISTYTTLALVCATILDRSSTLADSGKNREDFDIAASALSLVKLLITNTSDNRIDRCPQGQRFALFFTGLSGRYDDWHLVEDVQSLIDASIHAFFETIFAHFSEKTRYQSLRIWIANRTRELSSNEQKIIDALFSNERKKLLTDFINKTLLDNGINPATVAQIIRDKLDNLTDSAPPRMIKFANNGTVNQMEQMALFSESKTDQNFNSLLKEAREMEAKAQTFAEFSELNIGRFSKILRIYREAKEQKEQLPGEEGEVVEQSRNQLFTQVAARATAKAQNSRDLKDVKDAKSANLTPTLEDLEKIAAKYTNELNIIQHGNIYTINNFFARWNASTKKEEKQKLYNEITNSELLEKMRLTDDELRGLKPTAHENDRVFSLTSYQINRFFLNAIFVTPPEEWSVTFYGLYHLILAPLKHDFPESKNENERELRKSSFTDDVIAQLEFLEKIYKKSHPQNDHEIKDEKKAETFTPITIPQKFSRRNDAVSLGEYDCVRFFWNNVNLSDYFDASQEFENIPYTHCLALHLTCLPIEKRLDYIKLFVKHKNPIQLFPLVNEAILRELREIAALLNQNQENEFIRVLGASYLRANITSWDGIYNFITVFRSFTFLDIVNLLGTEHICSIITKSPCRLPYGVNIRREIINSLSGEQIFNILSVNPVNPSGGGDKLTNLLNFILELDIELGRLLLTKLGTDSVNSILGSFEEMVLFLKGILYKKRGFLSHDFGLTKLFGEARIISLTFNQIKTLLESSPHFDYTEILNNILPLKFVNRSTNFNLSLDNVLYLINNLTPFDRTDVLFCLFNKVKLNALAINIDEFSAVLSCVPEYSRNEFIQFVGIQEILALIRTESDLIKFLRSIGETNIPKFWQTIGRDRLISLVAVQSSTRASTQSVSTESKAASSSSAVSSCAVAISSSSSSSMAIDLSALRQLLNKIPNTQNFSFLSVLGSETINTIIQNIEDFYSIIKKIPSNDIFKLLKMLTQDKLLTLIANHLNSNYERPIIHLVAAAIRNALNIEHQNYLWDFLGWREKEILSSVKNMRDLSCYLIFLSYEARKVQIKSIGITAILMLINNDIGELKSLFNTVLKGSTKNISQDTDWIISFLGALNIISIINNNFEHLITTDSNPLSSFSHSFTNNTFNTMINNKVKLEREHITNSNNNTIPHNTFTWEIFAERIITMISETNHFDSIFCRISNIHLKLAFLDKFNLENLNKLLPSSARVIDILKFLPEQKKLQFLMLAISKIRNTINLDSITVILKNSLEEDRIRILKLFGAQKIRSLITTYNNLQDLFFACSLKNANNFFNFMIEAIGKKQLVTLITELHRAVPTDNFSFSFEGIGLRTIYSALSDYFSPKDIANRLNFSMLMKYIISRLIDPREYSGIGLFQDASHSRTNKILAATLAIPFIASHQPFVIEDISEDKEIRAALTDGQLFNIVNLSIQTYRTQAVRDEKATQDEKDTKSCSSCSSSKTAAPLPQSASTLTAASASATLSASFAAI